MTTDFSKKIEILSSLYMNYRDGDMMKDFIEYNDIGLPLAFLLDEGLCVINDEGTKYISETWDLFIAALEIEDEGFETLEEMFLKAEGK